jgi:hypothetical protein
MSNQPFIEDRKRDISWVVMDDYEPKLERLAGKIRETTRQHFFSYLRIYLSNILGLEVHTTIFFSRLECVCVFLVLITYYSV